MKLYYYIFLVVLKSQQSTNVKDDAKEELEKYDSDDYTYSVGLVSDKTATQLDESSQYSSSYEEYTESSEVFL